jgi:hypothetical protein
LDAFDSAGVGHVSSMNQEITIWDMGCICMGIGDADYTDRRLILRRLKRCPTEEEEDMVQTLYYGAKRG